MIITDLYGILNDGKGKIDIVEYQKAKNEQIQRALKQIEAGDFENVEDFE